MTAIATLLYVIKDGRVLLIMKKRGLGAGKYNGAGGKVEDGENPLDCAVRETREEIGITPQNVEEFGYLEFFKGEFHFMDVHVFTATDFSGELAETDEAVAEWFPTDRIPYGLMWADDEFWMPLMFEGKKFDGKFWFDENMKFIERHELEAE